MARYYTWQGGDPVLQLEAVSSLDEHVFKTFNLYITAWWAEIANELQCTIVKRRGSFYVLSVDCPPHDVEHYDGTEFWVLALEKGQRP